MKFKELVENRALRKAVKKLGWKTPTPIQEKAIPLIREGVDVVGIAQTGTGKTGAFMLPALERHAADPSFRTLVLCPTRELCLQVTEDARTLCHYLENVSVAEVYGGVRLRPQITRLKDAREMIVATPGRLLDHLERGTVDLGDISLLVLDEADRMLDMGFRPQIEGILRTLPKKRQTILISATMPNGVHALALRILKDPQWIEATPEIAAAETVTQTLYPVKNDKKPDLLLKLLEDDELDQVLVFTRTKRGADLLYSRLRNAGIEVSVLHGDRNMNERRRALNKFSEGQVRVLVATDVAQRGLDIEGISHVINYDIPQDPEEYIHRIGRTGRAGATGTAVTFMTGGDIGLVHAIERALGKKIPRISVPGCDYTGAAPEDGARKPDVRANRAGGRMGARSTSELSAEELKQLLDVG